MDKGTGVGLHYMDKTNKIMRNKKNSHRISFDMKEKEWTETAKKFSLITTYTDIADNLYNVGKHGYGKGIAFYEKRRMIYANQRNI